MELSTSSRNDFFTVSATVAGWQQSDPLGSFEMLAIHHANSHCEYSKPRNFPACDLTSFCTQHLQFSTKAGHGEAGSRAVVCNFLSDSPVWLLLLLVPLLSYAEGISVLFLSHASLTRLSRYLCVLISPRRLCNSSRFTHTKGTHLQPSP